MTKYSIKSADCDDYCYNFGCQNATNCPARAAQIDRVVKIANRKTVRQYAAFAAKLVLKRVAFALVSLMAVAIVCGLVVTILEVQKP